MVTINQALYAVKTKHINVRVFYMGYKFKSIPCPMALCKFNKNIINYLIFLFISTILGFTDASDNP